MASWVPLWGPLALAGLLIAALQPSTGNTQEIVGAPSACSTPLCLSVAEDIKAAIDVTQDPCEAPHLYFCGKWEKRFSLPSDESSWTKSFTNIHNKTREDIRELLEEGECPSSASSENTPENWNSVLRCLYKSCMDTDKLDSEGISPFVTQLQDTAPFLLQRIQHPESIVEEGKSLSPEEKKRILTDRLAIVYSDLRVGFFLSLDVNPTVLKPDGKYTLYVSESGLGLSYRQYEQKDPIAAYLKLVKTLLRQITADAGASATDDEILFRAESVLQMEMDIKNIRNTPEEARDSVATANPMTVANVTEYLKDGLDFTRFLDSYLSRYSLSLSPSDELIVDHPSFLADLPALITRTWTWEAIHDYLIIRALVSVTSSLPEAYRTASDIFRTEISGAAPQPRWKKCQSTISQHIGWVLSKKYVDFIPVAFRRKEIAESMVTDLTVTFKHLIENSFWMDAETKVKAVQKLGAVTNKLGYPDWLLINATSYFADYYGAPNVDAMKSLLAGTLHLKKENNRFEVGRLGQDKDNSEWHMFPQTVNAYYNPVMNEIVFPLSIMQDPFLRVWTECHDDEDCSPPEEAAFMEVLSYGGLGVVVGHELTHGFDDEGRHYGPDGQLKEWWTDASSNAFEKAAKCISDQYGSYSLRLRQSDGSLKDVHVSGNLTLGENIADNGGTKLAFLTLQRLHPEYFSSPIIPRILSDLGMGTAAVFSAGFAQLWCVSERDKALQSRVTGDPHSPDGLRIFGTLTNQQLYSDAFRCAPGTPMNPSNSTPSSSTSDVSPSVRSLRVEDFKIKSFGNRKEAAEPVFDQYENLITPKSSHRCIVW